MLHNSMFERIMHFICKIFLQILAHLIPKIFFEIHGINVTCWKPLGKMYCHYLTGQLANDRAVTRTQL